MVKLKYHDVAATFLLTIFVLAPFLVQPSIMRDNHARVEISAEAHTYTVTRRQAVIDFIEPLQMSDGSFIGRLHHAWAYATGLNSLYTSTVLEALSGTSSINVDQAIQFLASCQVAQGGFTANTWTISVTTTETHTAVTPLSIFGGLSSINQGTLASWLESLYRSDGGFDPSPSESSDVIWVTYAAVETLAYIGRLDLISSYLTTNRILEYYDAGGGFSLLPGDVPSGLGTYYGVSVLAQLNALHRISSTDTKNFLMTYYNPTTGIFRNDNSDNFYFLGALYILNRLEDVNSTATVDYILSCQSHLQGGFTLGPSEVGHSPFQGASECRYAVESLRFLGALDALDAAFTVDNEPVWTGDDTPPTTTTPPLPLSNELLLVGLLVGAIVTVFVTVVLINKWSTRSKTRKQKVVKRKKRKR